MPYSLDGRLIFPHPSLADDDGLLAIGGDLSSERLLLAYQHGIFPWFSDETPILWYAPHERFVLDPKELKITRSMQQFIRNSLFRTAHNTAFMEVIDRCATTKRKDQQGTWITADMQEAYIRLHELGYAHSVETYNENGVLVGGLYGIQIGAVFCGESMFSHASNASKLALINLCQTFNFELIDCQIYSEHLASLGAKFISGTAYYQLLQKQIIEPFAIQ
ncbi:leucyl/phenylalanyl-tRNA--protein transferase [Sphingobacterium chuzhouense]|uniref:Leucyl/phenylalanyl-tRNA--protein transferase n=1 Tax=Sphingobacterium chuzhouense TaxID=1742264 RepID=A0ABR7XWI2_9SPHI|nr:leucyl/phenylalanyl-tRNA--protein transferase [Sphingobacterium chuzhouense]MBD1423406.1 leucyl/phenylalanyl-tRNA--protein transferase [Sphingobacterium chuzhouense]